MKFFVEVTLKENLIIPNEQVYELATKFLNLLAREEKEPRVLFSIIGAGQRLALILVDVESYEELEKFMFSWPLYNIAKFKITLLVPMESHLSNLSKFREIRNN